MRWAAKSDVPAMEHGAVARDLEVVIMAGYGLALTVIGTVQLRRRDVTAGPGN